MPTDVLQELTGLPGLEFYAGATGRPNDNVEFDKTKFEAYQNSLRLAKMLLLQETDPLLPDPGPAHRGELSRLMTNALIALGDPGADYNWRLLNVVGDHGGDVMTTTLPKRVPFNGIAGVSGTAITVSADYPLHTGEPVSYDNRGTGSDIGGLVEGGVYWMSVSGTTVRLHPTYAQAIAGTGADRA